MSQTRPSSQKIKTYLQNNICIVTFEKADGTEREMLCTLLDQFLPSLVTNTNDPVDFPKQRRVSDESIAVWDLERQDWRSFRFDRMKKMKIKTGETTVDVLREVEL